MLLLVGCASPVKQLENEAAGYLFEADTIIAVADNRDAGDAIKLPMRIYVKPIPVDDNQPDYAFIFLEGDGRPWRRSVPSNNPNTHDSVVLPLMANVGPYLAAYIHRPCYGFALSPQGCDVSWWTSGRYSQLVVNLLSSSIDQLQQTWGEKKLILVGHSGGGALALLIANERDDIAAVVTLAGNLDHSAWTERFNYLPLENSLNAQDVSLQAGVLRWHLIAGRDKTIPTDISLAAAANDQHARTLIYDDVDHGCCWHGVWPDIYQQLISQLGE